LLVAHRDSGTVSAYSLDPQTGALAETDTLALGADPEAISIDDAGAFAYVAMSGEHELAVLDLSDPLHPQECGRIRTRTDPTGTALLSGIAPVRPRAHALYAVNREDGSVSTYSVEPTGGTLTEIGSAVLAGSTPAALAVDPLARYVWVASPGDDTVITFEVDDQTEGLTQVGLPLAVAIDPAGIAVDPAGRQVFVTRAGSDRVSSFSVDQGTGALTAVDAVDTGDEPGAVAVDPTGRFVYVASEAADEIAVFRVVDGVFTQSLAVASAPGAPCALRFSADGSLLYVALRTANFVLPYAVDPVTGALTPQVPGAQADDSPRAMQPNPRKPRAYAALALPGDGGLGVYALDEEGNPTFLEALTGSGLKPVDVAIDPGGAFLYVANEEGDDVTRFTLDGAGDAAQAGATPAGDGPIALGLLSRVE